VALPRIVLHIGPEKCGSTSIQHAIRQETDACHGLILDPYELIGLDTDAPSRTVIQSIKTQMERLLTSVPSKTLIVSHEMLFKSRNMLTGIAQLARSLSDEVVAVAYVRRQSDFIVSGYGQWHFRSPTRIDDARAILMKHGLDPVLFWGVERHLIAGLLEGWKIARQPSGHLYLDWYDSVASRQAALDKAGVHLSVGLLPRPGFDRPLITDFERRARLPSGVFNGDDVPRNTSYPAGLIEATLNAIEAGEDMPGPHDANNFFAGSVEQAWDSPPSERFVAVLKAAIDTEFANKNNMFTRDHDLPAAYFEPEETVSLAMLKDHLSTEADRRRAKGREHFQSAAKARAVSCSGLWKAHQAATAEAARQKVTP
jgi:hypothetical protein